MATTQTQSTTRRAPPKAAMPPPAGAPTRTLPATTTPTNGNKLSAELETELRPEVLKVLPAHITADKFMRVVYTAIVQSPDLKAVMQTEAGKRSFFTACVKCATDGLVPDGREAALVMYKNKIKRTVNGRTVEEWVPMAQYIPMVYGVIKLMDNAGVSVTCNVVCEADSFDYWTDDIGEHLLHKPAILANDRGGTIAVYAIGKFKDGRPPKIEVMTRKQVEQVRSFSKAKDSGPWVHWYDEMARKSVIHRISKYIATTPEIERVIQRDHDLYDLEQRATKQITGQSGTAAAKALLGLTDLPPEVTDEPTEQEVHADTPVRVTALRLFKDAETIEALEAAWDAVLADYSDTNEQIPPDVEDAYKAAKAAFNEPAHSGE